MPFIGNQPALSYTSFAKQDFSTSATTSYTLDNPVANANELALFINFVRQEPTTAYSASGTSLTLTESTSVGDDMYCVYLGKAVQTVNPPNASVGLSQLTASGTKDATTFLRGDNTFAEAGGGNTVAISHVQDTTDYSQSNQGETVFGSGLTFTPASTTSQVVAFIEASVICANDGSDNDARTVIRFYSTNSSGNSIKENDATAELGHVNMQSSNHEFYSYITSIISNCQRDSSNNVVIKLTAVSNEDSGTTIYVRNHRAVFMEIG